MERKIYLDYLYEEFNSSLVVDDDADLGVIIEVTKSDGSSCRDSFKFSRKILERLAVVFCFSCLILILNLSTFMLLK